MILFVNLSFILRFSNFDENLAYFVSKYRVFDRKSQLNKCSEISRFPFKECFTARLYYSHIPRLTLYTILSSYKIAFTIPT